MREDGLGPNPRVQMNSSLSFQKQNKTKLAFGNFYTITEDKVNACSEARELLITDDAFNSTIGSCRDR